MDDNNNDSDDEIPTLQNLDESIADEPLNDDALQNLDETTQQQEKNDVISSLPPVPVTILTGFLGSGKTTLVRHILTSPQHQKRIAVIENEFGGGESDVQLAERLGLTVNDVSTLSVETMIAKDGTSGSSLADFIELPNGCVCCTVKDSLVETLENLLSKRTDLDYIIIEASGMADPGPVASIFWLDEALESRIRLDGIVTCVDAKNIHYQLESTSSAKVVVGRSIEDNSMQDGGGDEAARQIAFADRIIVNKVDLLQALEGENATTIDAVLQEIKSINPTAPIKTTTYSKIEELNWILDAKCFDSERAKDVEAAFQQSIDNNMLMQNLNNMKCNNPSCTVDHARKDAMCGLCSESPPSSDGHQHTSAVGTIALFGRGSVDLHKINSWLASILWPDQDESDKVLRARLEEDLLSQKVEGKNAKGALSNIYNPSSSEKGKQKIYRIKGILSVGHAVDEMGETIPNDWVDDGLAAGLVSPDDLLDRRRFIVQAVNDLWDVHPASQNLCWDANETRCCKIVVIGRWLDESHLQEGFRDCFDT